MKKEINSPSAILRQKAEESLTLRHSTMSSQTTNTSDADTLKVIHELEVHQIELELQNEELTLAKEQAEIATERYAELYDFAPSGYFTLAPDGKIIELNLTGAQMFGKERSNLKNSKFDIFVSEDKKTIFKLFLEKVFKTKSRESCEVTLMPHGNVPMFVHLSGIAFSNNKECNIILTDMTSQKLKEEELRQSEAKYRTIFECMQDSYFEASIDGKILEISPSIEIISKGKYSRKELIGKFLGEVYLNPDDRNNYISKLIQDGSLTDYELSVRNKDGSIIPVAVSALLSYDAQGNPVKLSGIIRDITERKLNEKRILDLNISLEGANMASG